MKDILLCGKKIRYDESEVLFSYKPDEHWQEYFDIKSGEWHYENGALIGIENGNMGGILFTKESYDGDVMLSFTVSAVLPATRDLNAVFCAHWDEETDYLGESYVCGVNGWYEHKAGIERNGVKGNPASNLCAIGQSYDYTPGTELRMTCGAIGGHTFMQVGDRLVAELRDPFPLTGGHLGFSAYCTILRITDIEVRRIKWEPFRQRYTPEF